MGHPDRKLLRAKRRQKKTEEGLAKRNNLGVLDLTPHNAVRIITAQKCNIIYK